MYWASIESSIDPGDFRRFMTAYPQHPLASEARTREETLVAQGSPTTPLPDFASIVPEAGEAGNGGAHTALARRTRRLTRSKLLRLTIFWVLLGMATQVWWIWEIWQFTPPADNPP